MDEEKRSTRSLPTISTSFEPFRSRSPRYEADQERQSPLSGSRSDYDRPFDLSTRRPYDTGNRPQSSSGSATGSQFPTPRDPSMGSRYRPSRPDFVQSSMQHLGPPPLAPYVTPDRRYHAPRPAQQQWLGPDGLRPASQDRPVFPPPPKPPPPHIVAAATAAARGESSRFDPDRPSHRLPSIPPFHSRSLSHSPTQALPTSQLPPRRPMSQSARLHPPSPSYLSLTPPGSRGDPQVHPPPPLSTTPLQSYRAGPALSRTNSQDSHQSHHSQHSHHSYAMHRDPSGGSSASGSSLAGESSTLSGQTVPHGGPRKKRTRALMTHMQQSGLMKLWKKTKFPTGSEREKLGQEIGLTPRQVQVWFQNQRQKSRKTLMVNGGIPQGEDPADYEDLQKSPRSRRLSLEGEDRISAWAGSSSSSVSTGRMLVDPHLSAGVSYEPVVRHHSRSYNPNYPDESPHGSISLRSPSPYDRWNPDEVGHAGKSAQQQHHRHHRHSHHRSNSMHHGPPQYGQGPQSRHQSRSPNQPISPRWERPFPSVLDPPHSSPADQAYSPPPTAQGLVHYDRPSMSAHNPLQRRRSSPSLLQEFQPPRSSYPGDILPMRPSVNRSRSHSGEAPADREHATHLPPTLARIALSGPIERGRLDHVDLPGIERPPSPTLPRIIPSKRERSEDSTQGQLKASQDQNEKDVMMARREGKRPMSSSLSALLD
ncbi:hypothetical protein IAU59_000926 [Kwoniella sp. CBS 9459]